MTDVMNERFVKTGIFLAPFHPLHENPLLALERDMDLLVHLDKLNYHEAWIAPVGERALATAISIMGCE